MADMKKSKPMEKMNPGRSGSTPGRVSPSPSPRPTPTPTPRPRFPMPELPTKYARGTKKCPTCGK